MFVSRCDPTQNQRAERFAILLDDVSIIHLTFGQEYTAAIEAKQVGTSSKLVDGQEQ